MVPKLYFFMFPLVDLPAMAVLQAKVEFIVGASQLSSPQHFQVLRDKNSGTTLRHICRFTSTCMAINLSIVLVQYIQRNFASNSPSMRDTCGPP